MLSRRETLLAGAGAVVAGFAGGAPAIATPVAPAAPLTRGRFTPLLGTDFELEPVGGTGARPTVTLVGAPGTELVFALHFGTAAPVREGIYRLHHPATPAVELFLAPTGPTPGRLEAVVHRGAA